MGNDLFAEGSAAFADNPDHRTSPLPVLTEQGRHTLSAINRRAATSDRRLTDAVGSATIAETRAGVRRLITALVQ